MSKKAGVAAFAGSLFGGMAGVMLGGFAGAQGDRKMRRHEDDESEMMLTGMGAVVGGVLGAVLGATIGAGALTPADLPTAGAAPGSKDVVPAT